MKKKPLAITIDPKSAVPVYEQVKQAIKWLILSGHLEEGDQLPSLRELASTLRINPNTIVKIYFHLEVEGFIRSQVGSGFFVNAVPEQASGQRQKLFNQLSEEYLSKVSDLGFGPDDVIGFIQEKGAPLATHAIEKKEEKKNGHDS